VKSPLFLAAVLTTLAAAPIAIAQDCPPYLEPCIGTGGICVDPDNDERYCGCTPMYPGEYCMNGEMCINGVCVLVCPSPLTKCGNYCADLSKDEDNCGYCGNVCPPGFLCENGNCVICEPVTSEELGWGSVKAQYQ
jgi:hypothetical protein